jgi:hypothetical protein
LNKYINVDPIFYDSPEYNLLKESIDGLEENNQNKFNLDFKKYKEINKLDKWVMHMFTKILDKFYKMNSNDNENYYL